MDTELTIASTLTAVVAALSAGLFCLKKCPPGKALVICRNGQTAGSKDYKIVSGGRTLVLPGLEHSFLLDLTPFEVQISDNLPPSIAAGASLFLHASLRICIDSDVNALALAAAHFEGLTGDQIAKRVSSHLASQPLAIEALPGNLSDLSDPTVSGPQLTNFWNEELCHLGMKALKYEFTGITNTEESVPHTPYTGEDAISQLCRFLDFQVRHEHFDIVVSNPARFDSQILLSWTLGAKLNQAPHSLARASAVFLGKDADDIKTMISDELIALVDGALLSSGTYAMLAHLERQAQQIGLGKATTTKQFVLRVLNALAEQSLTWRGKLSFIRFVLSGLKVAQQLHSQFLKASRAKFSDWGLDLIEITLGSLDLKSMTAASASDGTIEIAATEVCAQLEARWPITLIDMREALVHVNVCLKNDNKNNTILAPINDELKAVLTSSLEGALNSNKWRVVFASVEKLMAEIGPEELERGDLRTDRALEELIDRIGVTSFFLKVARILLNALEAYGEARRRFISNSQEELRKRGLAIGTFAIVNIDLDREA
jgi:hypothetical protein